MVIRQNIGDDDDDYYEGEDDEIKAFTCNENNDNIQ